jgi:ligand-binding sensor domain-containing protein
VLDRTQRSFSRIALANQNDKKEFAVTSWMKSGQFVDYDAITSMAVDGDVWFGTKTGQIQKFTSGKSVDFALSNLPQLPNSPVSIYTDDASKNVYILEPQQNRLIIAEKSGVVLREITSSTFASSTALVASEAAGKIFVLSGSLIFEMNL